MLRSSTIFHKSPETFISSVNYKHLFLLCKSSEQLKFLYLFPLLFPLPFIPSYLSLSFFFYFVFVRILLELDPPLIFFYIHPCIFIISFPLSFLSIISSPYFYVCISPSSINLPLSHAFTFSFSLFAYPQLTA